MPKLFFKYNFYGAFEFCK